MQFVVKERWRERGTETGSDGGRRRGTQRSKRARVEDDEREGKKKEAGSRQAKQDSFLKDA